MTCVLLQGLKLLRSLSHRNLLTILGFFRCLIGTPRHQNKVESLDLLKVRSHSMFVHFSLEIDSVRELILSQPSSESWRATSNPN